MTTSHLQRMANRASGDPFFLGSILDSHRTRNDLGLDQLATQLNITKEKLAELYLCRNLAPASEDFASQVDAVAEAIGCESLVLLKMLREESVLAQLQKPSGITAPGMTLAARDQKNGLDSSSTESADE